MDKPTSDIIVPVWNRPVETRNCLVNLIEHSPDARLIIVDNGSDRETERMLEEFAEILDQKAILLRNNINQGYVRAVNRGLARAESDYIAIVRNTSIVTSSWLEPLTRFAANRSDAGIFVPRLVRATEWKPGGKKHPDTTIMESDRGSLSAMLITRRAYDMIGGIDEELAGGVWCLRDLSRRAYRRGLSTFRVLESVVVFEDDVPLGSIERRNMALQRSIELYGKRWGEPRSFCIHFPKGADMDMLRQRLDVVLLGARQGHFFSLITHSQLFNEAAKAGLQSLHENVHFVRIPMFSESRAIEKALKPGNPDFPDAEPVAAIDGIPFTPGIKGLPFALLQQIIIKTSKEIYGG